MKFIFAVAAVVLMMGSAFAKEETFPELKESTTDVNKVTYPWMTDEEFKAALKGAQERSTRKVASATGIDYEGQMSDDLKEIRNKILNLKKPKEIDAFLDLYLAEQKFNSLQPDAKLLMSQLMLLRPFKGIVYRLAPLAAKTNITHSILLSFVMRQATEMRVYFPTEQASALFDYLTQPFDGVIQFNEGEDFQTYLSDIVYPLAVSSSDVIRNIPVDKPMVWDNKILYADIVDSKIDTQDRYTLIGAAEKWALLSAKQMGLHFIAAFRAYTVKNVMQMSKEMGSLYGVDGFTTALLPNGTVDGVNSLERNKVFKKAKYATTFRLYRDGGDWMKRSFGHMQEATKYLRIAWDEVKDKPAAENFLLNPIFFTGFNRQISNHLAALEDIVKGPTKIRSRMTGETIVVDLKGFYMNPPKDLKSLLPTNFEKPKDGKFNHVYVKVGKNTKAEKVDYYNYFHGRPTDWNKDAYKPLFPQIKKGTDVQTAARIMAQSWGGVVLAGPLRAVIR